MSNYKKLENKLKELMSKYEHDEYIESRTRKNDGLKIIGITGSNGKTTTAMIVHEYLKRIGKTSVLFASCGIDLEISNYSYNNEVEIPIYNETSLINAINGAIKERADYLILEINERTIEKGYIEGIPFSIRALTNIVPKHNTLSYTEEEYVNIKKSFFKVDDEDDCTCIYTLTEKELLEDLIRQNNKPYKVVSSEYVARVKGVEEAKIDYMLHQGTKEFDSLEGLNFNIKTKTKDVECHTNLIMPFNALNITLAYAILDSLGEMEDSKFNQLLEEIKIPGRDEVIRYNGRTIIIMITCTPHLEIIKRYKEKGKVKNIRLVTGSFGKGFNSWLEEYKEEKFTKYVEESMRWAYSYFVKNVDQIYITTNDNAYSNITELLGKQKKEVEGKTTYFLIEDRKEAIKKAIEDSERNDVIIISGRGNRSIFCKDRRNVEIYLDRSIVEEEIIKKKEEDNAN